MLGVNALFSTAYGNVGSSIYYALGLVASFALGLTPVVFVITGVFFFCTAATYAEATAKPIFTPADSLTPTMFSVPSRTTTTMPPMMSPGESPSALQNTPR